MSPDEKAAPANVAFFAVRPTADNQGYIGAALVTDEMGVPKEFRCTHPVRPSAVQKALYGGNLESHISLELCAKPLLQTLTTHPVACLVESQRMVILRGMVEVPIVHVQRLGEVFTTGAREPAKAGTFGDSASGGQRLDSTVGGFQPLSIRTHGGFEKDLEGLVPVLERVFQHVDLLEPFERITTALRVLAERDERFR